jgi:hypothetical protein
LGDPVPAAKAEILAFAENPPLSEVLMHINPIGKFLLIIGGAFLATAAAASAQTADATTINNKVMAGYQGWFRTPGDEWFRGKVT